MKPFPHSPPLSSHQFSNSSQTALNLLCWLWGNPPPFKCGTIDDNQKWNGWAASGVYESQSSDVLYPRTGQVQTTPNLGNAIKPVIHHWLLQELNEPQIQGDHSESFLRKHKILLWMQDWNPRSLTSKYICEIYILHTAETSRRWGTLVNEYALCKCTIGMQVH